MVSPANSGVSVNPEKLPVSGFLEEITASTHLCAIPLAVLYPIPYGLLQDALRKRVFLARRIPH